MKHPEWWFWDIEISSHVEKRMVQRSFTEIDLRSMLFFAQDHKEDIEEGRFKILSELNHVPWEIIVEPDHFEKLLVIVTAYPLEDRHA
jgi:hypothetical protein